MKSVILLVGIGFLAAAGYSAWQTSRFIADSVAVDGRVVALNAGGSHPHISFRALTGQSVSYPQGGMIGGYTVGDAVRVRYLAAGDPTMSATLDTFGALWVVPVALAFFASCFFAGAVQARSNPTLTVGRH